MSSFFRKVDAFFEGEKHSHSHGHPCNDLHPEQHAANRFQSFAAPSTGNAKWFVDGCSYFWAVSEALEQAEQSIFILDWWLSPELYLRRPPSKNEQYRLDAMLQAAAERGVKVNVIVYKEVKAALTLDSEHTKRALEALHPNISVFRHPDHMPTGYDLTSELGDTLSNLTNFDLATASKDAVKALYGATDDVVLFWAHHEKLLLIDHKIAFMGGLDLCFGRWDTNSHPIADVHPGDLDNIIFPGQDYNNARIFDFSDVNNWNQNKLDRTKSSRMGWSDVSLCINGAIVSDLVSHFVDRWNFIYDAKYEAKAHGKYQRLTVIGTEAATEPEYNQSDGLLDRFTHTLVGGMKSLGFSQEQPSYDDERNTDDGATRIQLTRSCCKWSSGHPTEHSIANAYVSAITNAEHFVYIENQFFITATSDEQHPVSNKIGAAIVDRIVRAYEEGQPFKVLVVMPAVPAFAGDLKSKGALGTRAIMEFQYNSISRGKNSILEKVRAAGIEDPSRYIGFYNLRNFDRINTSNTMQEAEERAGVSYEEARKEHDDYVGAGRYPEGEDSGGNTYNYQSYQRGAIGVEDTTLDTISSCYMDGSSNIVDIPWDGEPEDEINAFVSEQLYIHTKLLIADDRLVICGSANLNDRSQLGTHDSEIAVVIEGAPTIDSFMNGRPYRASQFAASLRRYISRKHLGLLPDQRWDQPGQNWHPVTETPNDYDWHSPADLLVRDPLHHNFLNLWENTARTNTEVFSRAFHPVPDNNVRTWEDYDEFFSKYFIIPSGKKEQDEEGEQEESRDGRVEYGHIVREEFPGGVDEVKAWLGRVRGTLVNMPLDFLVDVKDIAKEGLTLNGLTDELYT